MTRQQRLGLVAAAVVVLAAAFILIPRDDEPDSDATPTTAAATPTPAATPSATAEPSETATPAPTPTATPEPEPEVPVLQAGGDEQLNFREGETIRFRVRSDVADEVHLHGYDVTRDVKAGGTVTFELKATITGIFEIELENAGTPVGTLRVDPR